ncbi:hypothetical protein MCEMIEM12_00198 [Burkholderiaceae bacterium]|jgi:hypothetical protein
MKYIFFFGIFWGGLMAMAQDKPDAQVVQGLNIVDERAKLAQMRSKIDADYSTTKKACYQKLAVTSCLEKARQVKYKQDNEHKRLSLVLNDAERRQNAAEALQRTEDKQSPDQQAERESQRADRLQQQSDRQERHIDTNQKQQDKEAEKSSKREAHAKHVQEVLERRQKHEDKLKAAAQSRANHQRKLDEAAQHRAQVEKDSASRNPPAQPLPPRPSDTP